MSPFDAAYIFDRFKRLLVICAVFALSGAAMAQSSAQDPVLAKIYFEQGKAAHDGAGQPQDFTLARENYLTASELGSSDALINLGYMYSMGEGVDRNYLTARKYYERAAKLGESVAKKNLRMMDELGLGIATENVLAAPEAVRDLPEETPPSKPAPVIELSQAREIDAPDQPEAQNSSEAPQVAEMPKPIVPKPIVQKPVVPQPVMSESPDPIPTPTPTQSQIPAPDSEEARVPNIQTPNDVVKQIDPKPIETRVGSNVWESPGMAPRDQRSRLLALSAIIAGIFILILVLIQRERQARRSSEQYFMDTFYEAKRGEICHIYLRRHNGEFTDSEFFVQWNAMLKVLIVRFAMQYKGGDHDVIKIAEIIKRRSQKGSSHVQALIEKYDNEILDRTVSDVKAVDSFYHASTSNVKAPSGSSGLTPVPG